jgi:hypothetical protein
VDLTTTEFDHSYVFARAKVESGVKRLVNDFKNRGMDSLGHPIVIVVQEDEFCFMDEDVSGLASEPRADAPVIGFTVNKVKCGAGQHRTAAALRYMDMLRVEMNALPIGSSKRQSVQEAHDAAGWWIAAVYDQSAYRSATWARSR